MKFESLRCDECGRIQDTANHWLKMALWKSDTGNTVSLGLLAQNLRTNTDSPYELHDLCGQGCAMKHLAKLLGWSSVLEAQKE